MKSGRRERREMAGAKAARVLAAFTAVAGVCVSVVLFQTRRALENRLLRDAFDAAARDAALVVERELRLFSEVLASLGHLHELSADVDRAAFEEFVSKGLAYPRELLGVFGWAPRVQAAERALYEEAMRRAGHAGFEILERAGEALVPAGLREDYFPVSYAEPRGAKELPLGVDLAADPENRAAMAIAARTGEIAAGGEAGAGCWAFSLIGGRGERAEVKGFVVALLEPERVFRRALGYLGPGGVEVDVFDADHGRGKLIFTTGRRVGQTGATGAAAKAGAGRILSRRHRVALGGRSWEIECRPSDAFWGLYRTGQPWALLLGGLAATALLAAQLLSFAGRARRIEEVVRERTAELTAANIALRKTMEERRRLEQRILEIADQEQRRVGQDLHDSLGQQLTGLGYLAAAMERELTSAGLPQAERAAQVRDRLQQAVAQVRRIARGLVPVDVSERGLAAALERLAEDTRAIAGVACRFESTRPVLIYDPSVAINLYRIAQEAVGNALRHAVPRQVTIRLRVEGGRGVLEVEDDGRGISGAAGKEGLGLALMRYRADLIGGRLEIAARAGGGTTVRCEFPCGVPQGEK